jgi:hypothetical protein
MGMTEFKVGATTLWTWIVVTLVAEALSEGATTSAQRLSAAVKIIPTRLIIFPD